MAVLFARREVLNAFSSPCVILSLMAEARRMGPVLSAPLHQRPNCKSIFRRSPDMPCVLRLTNIKKFIPVVCHSHGLPYICEMPCNSILCTTGRPDTQRFGAFQTAMKGNSADYVSSIVDKQAYQKLALPSVVSIGQTVPRDWSQGKHSFGSTTDTLT